MRFRLSWQFPALLVVSSILLPPAYAQQEPAVASEGSEQEVDGESLVQERKAAQRLILSRLGLQMEEGSDGLLRVEKRAEQADSQIKVGDKVVAANEQPVINLNRLANVLQDIKTEQVVLKVTRGSETANLTVSFVQTPVRMEPEEEQQSFQFAGATFLASDKVPAIVAEVAPKTPAWESGLREGDEVLSINEVPSDSFDALQTSLNDALADQQRLTVPVQVKRAGEEEQFVVQARTEEQVATRMRRGSAATVTPRTRPINGQLQPSIQGQAGQALIRGESDAAGIAGYGVNGGFAIGAQGWNANGTNMPQNAQQGIVFLQQRSAGEGAEIVYLSQVNGGVQIVARIARASASQGVRPDPPRINRAAPVNRAAEAGFANQTGQALDQASANQTAFASAPTLFVAIGVDGDLRRYESNASASFAQTSNSGGPFVAMAPLVPSQNGTSAALIEGANLQQLIGRSLVILRGADGTGIGVSAAVDGNSTFEQQQQSLNDGGNVAAVRPREEVGLAVPGNPVGNPNPVNPQGGNPQGNRNVGNAANTQPSSMGRPIAIGVIGISLGNFNNANGQVTTPGVSPFDGETPTNGDPAAQPNVVPGSGPTTAPTNQPNRIPRTQGLDAQPEQNQNVEAPPQQDNPSAGDSSPF